MNVWKTKYREETPLHCSGLSPCSISHYFLMSERRHLHHAQVVQTQKKHLSYEYFSWLCVPGPDAGVPANHSLPHPPVALPGRAADFHRRHLKNNYVNSIDCTEIKTTWLKNILMKWFEQINIAVATIHLKSSKTKQNKAKQTKQNKKNNTPTALIIF